MGLHHGMGEGCRLLRCENVIAEEMYIHASSTHSHTHTYSLMAQQWGHAAQIWGFLGLKEIFLLKSGGRVMRSTTEPCWTHNTLKKSPVYRWALKRLKVVCHMYLWRMASSHEARNNLTVYVDSGKWHQLQRFFWQSHHVSSFHFPLKCSSQSWASCIFTMSGDSVKGLSRKEWAGGDSNSSQAPTETSNRSW